ncbi:sodium/solute symporter [Flindersiella endophytica]
MGAAPGVLAVVLVTLLTLGIGAYGLRLSRTTSDFYVASRTVSPTWNASAIGGEYLSAASFLGAAGLILAYGADMLWYPVGWTAGYLVLLVLVAGPLRRSGAYTLPDFAEVRLQSDAARRVASVLVVAIGWLYLMPQFRGAGLTLQTATGAPDWAGGLVVGGVVLANVLSGGMRSITLVQAFQYWLKLTAIALPVLFLFLAWRSDGAPVAGVEQPVFREMTTVRVDTSVSIQVDRPVVVTVNGVVDGTRRADVRLRLGSGSHSVLAGTTIVFPRGAAVPVAEGLPELDNRSWAMPLGGGQDHPLYATYSLIIATFLGTMGLPHVLVRFYTNPDGRAARRTALAVIALLGAFYLFPAAYGALGRIYTPELLFTGRTDAVVLELPQRLLPGLGGTLLGMLVTSGAFAAFLSTSSGLAVSVTGVLSQDLLRGRAPSGVTGFRLAAVGAVAVPVLLALIAERLSVAGVVGLAFAVAASTFCPLLILGIWWRRLTSIGAVAGLVVGGLLAGGAVVAALVSEHSGWAAALLEQPAAWSVPAAFLVMVVVSLLTPRWTATDVGRTMVRLHAPEQIDVDRGEWRPSAEQK